MQIVFSMDGIKDMDQLYTWSTEYLFDSIPGKTEHYHGQDYCEKIIAGLSDWKDKKYLGMQGRIANETFKLFALDDTEYIVAFGINTYEEKLPAADACDTEAEDIEKSVRQHDQQQEVEKLKRELACAVLNENYERAARLRDLIAEFTPESITEQTE